MSVCDSRISEAQIRKFPNEAWNYTFGISIIIISSLATIENLVILILYFKHKDLRTTPNRILLSIVASDLLTGITVGPLFAGVLLDEAVAEICSVNVIRNYFAVLFMGTSAYSVAFLAIHRSLKMRYGLNIQLSRALIYGVLAMIWVVFVIFPTISLLSVHYTAFVIYALGVLAIIILMCSYFSYQGP